MASGSTHAAPTASGPSLSIIIPAHFRREFLRSAVESVQASDDIGPSTEIIVVKNFDDPSLDPWLKEHGVRVVRTEAAPIGAKVALGIQAASGDVLLFLEDDDRFLSTKLAKVRKEFRADPMLSFYHNAFRYIRADGAPLPPALARAASLRVEAPKGRVTIRGRRSPSQLRALSHRHPDFNNSCIAISRELASRAIPELARVPLAVDTLLFYLALVGTGTVVVDGTVLTEYRLHSGNASTTVGTAPEESARQKWEVGARLQADYQVVLEVAARSPDPAVRRNAEALVWMSRIFQRLRYPTPQRLAMLRDLRGVRRYWGTYPARTDRLVVLGSVLYPILPRLVGRIYRHKSTTGDLAQEDQARAAS